MFPTFETLRLVGGSPEAMRAFLAIVAAMLAAYLVGAVLWRVLETTLELALIRQDIRERAWLTVFREQARRAGGLS